MSFNEVDETLVAYFKQMLEEESVDSADGELEYRSKSQEHFETPVGATQQSTAQDDHSQEGFNFDEDAYQQIDGKLENNALLQTQTAPDNTEPSASLPYAEPKSLQSLLENIETKTKTSLQTDTDTQVATDTEVASETEVASKTQTQEAQTTATDTQVLEQTTTTQSLEDTHEAELEKADTNDNEHSEYEWKNIEMPNDFQALFFIVKGIRFAVPLVNLGGIFQSEKVTPLFGKPDWFMGIADIRGKKMNVVDTLKWVKSDSVKVDNYEYMIALGETLWAIGCDKLEGNRILQKENVTWRETAGNRPWLAGIVKKEMCALLHVDALVKMFENGVNLKDLDTQMSE